ncbi:parallel beta-helix repeat protein [Vibrio phage 1.030.O._10N.222.55.F9]|nr:parallel beta-helix repeat protein [Vibrio phage 1.030.O._10N.222.55.F9]
MAYSPSEKYPGAVDTDPDYQGGKFRDNNPSTTNNGSPLKAIDRNELLARDEAIMNDAGFKYNGLPDTPDDSQLFKAYKASLGNGANLLSNHNFLIASPDDSQPLPSATPTSYPPGYQIFSGVFANETTGITNLTYIDGRVSFSGGDFYMPVSNTNGLERVTDFVASVADFDGKPRTRGVSFALVGDNYRVTVGIDALEDAGAVLTPLGSVKFEQGGVATGHETTEPLTAQTVGGVTNYQAASVVDMIAGLTVGGEIITHIVGQVWGVYGQWNVKTVSSPMSINDFEPLGAINAKDFGLIDDSDGTTGSGTDNIPFLQEISSYISGKSHSVYIPSTSSGRWYRVSGSGATVASPVIGIDVTSEFTDIFGDGNSSRFFMDDVDTAYLNSQPSEGAGEDIFTIFRFKTFNVSVRDIFAKGLHVKGTSPDLSVPRPRCKIVGCDATIDLSVDRVNGFGIPGNVVNARGFTGNSKRVVTKGCHAHGCAENGINYMGGTEDCSLISNICINNGFQGIETGTNGLVCIGNICHLNRNGISQVGSGGSIVGNYCNDNNFSGIHIQYNNATFPGKDNVVSGNFLKNNFDNLLTDSNADGNQFIGNRTIGGSSGIKVPATTSNFTIHDNVFDGAEDNAINILGGNGHSVKSNRTVNSGNFSISMSGTEGMTVVGNDFDGVVSIGSASNLKAKDNNGFITENFGEYEVPSNTTTVTIPHGLTTTPNFVQATMDVDNYNYTVFPTSTNINIKKEGGAGFVAGEKIFWEARVKF